MLFKYCPEPLFFENGLIRFTQPIALNDPEESLPRTAIGFYSPEDYETAREQTRESGFPFTSDVDIERFALAPFSAGRFDERSFPGLWPMQEPRLRERPFETLEEFDGVLAERAVELVRDWADKSMGILSLSKSTEDAMWGYYAANHSGIAIGFDERHPFFASAVQPVIYSDEPMRVSSNQGVIRFGGVQWNNEDVLNGLVRSVPRDLFLRKRCSWKHEQEWRMIAELSTANQIADQRDTYGYPVHLFEIPKDAVRTLVFGYRATDDLVRDTMEKIASGWEHLLVSRRRRSRAGPIEEFPIDRVLR